MAKWSKTKDNVKAKVIEDKINNPDAKLRELWESNWLSTSTVDDILKKDLPEVRKSSENIAKLIDSNNNLHSLADSLLSEMITNKDDKVTPASLVSLRESTFKQNQILTWWVTDRIETSDLDEKQKRLIAERILKNKA